ncbi:hypothetical protein PHYBLDRAFT_72192 [Phycomyces blakesleeanus NRRL 1555(-)]|uniref:Uncharacterized protein n=1 Tax=Phycomyces blakesleeanus (strain ATCC 8743b / DSM 1359 / FGSC 10004 / NBRC 33097 / NRRL 1555) TaxID=763407 RepID=A0A162ZM98_PHYB8|nr:hypothetical protein PHYBLDRAFT_72192 [Phycomyces blakesleeanus NRRL 1555(-)]OAD67781.1 hypothetical protein PHYBLDRAFT_72192 [Phycomyces blakesleeanus NRRL 1555(-)]|eukprot:XP_018285821.1 hypothetical protein PHYBLDRAFT_72192 [Phycomyces blakesleeanus NRRL 1555(-)]
MSCLNRDGLNDFQFAPLILSVSQNFSGPLTKTYTLGGFTKCHWSLSRSSFFDYTPTLILYRQTNNVIVFCVCQLFCFLNCLAKKACRSKQWNTVGVDCTRGGPMDVRKE